MNLEDLVFADFIPTLAWLGRKRWVSYVKEVATATTRCKLVDFPLLPSEGHHIPALESIQAICKASTGYFPAFLSLSRALANGVKLFRPSDHACRLTELVDPTVTFAEYRQPYPALFIEVPQGFRKELTERFKTECPRFVLIYHDKDTGYIFLTTITAEQYMSFSVVPQPEYNFVSDALKVPHEDDADMHQSDVLDRMAINLCLLLVNKGAKTLGPANPGRMKKLAKAAHNKKKGKANRAQQRAEFEPMLIGFAQATSFSFPHQGEPNGKDDSTRHREEEGGPRKPHWRRGHIRMQRVGMGRTETKLVYIEPQLINARFFGGDLKDTSVTYTAKPSKSANSCGLTAGMGLRNDFPAETLSSIKQVSGGGTAINQTSFANNSQVIAAEREGRRIEKECRDQAAHNLGTA